jgi:HSP20 family protein
MEEKDIEMSPQEGILTLKGEKKSESNGSPYSETAAFKNGVLTITAAKHPETQRRVKRIAINA